MYSRNSLNHFSPQQQWKGIVNTKHTQGLTKRLKINTSSKLHVFVHIALFILFRNKPSITIPKHSRKKKA